MDYIYKKHTMKIDVTEGLYIGEGHSRFLCTIEIEGKKNLCYVASTTKISKSILLNGKRVLLVKASDPQKTQFTLFATVIDGIHILLNLHHINTLLKEYLNSLGYSNIKGNLLREKRLNNDIRSDFYYTKRGKDTIIEAKGILSMDAIANFPNAHTVRAINQLQEFMNYLNAGFIVEYHLVLMNPSTTYIKLNKHYSEFCRVFIECFKKGMKICIHSVEWKNQNFTLYRIKSLEKKFCKELKETVLPRN